MDFYFALLNTILVKFSPSEMSRFSTSQISTDADAAPAKLERHRFASFK
jgi:hypothetical protein